MQKEVKINMKYLVCITFFLTGCITTHKLSKKTYPAKPENCKIDILNQKPDKAFEEIVLLKTTLKRDSDKIWLDMKKKACQAGGDAILITLKKSKNFQPMYFNLSGNTAPITFTPSGSESIPMFLHSDTVDLQKIVIKYME